MAKPPGRCIFCGSHGLTKEHIWADWLRAYIPRIMLQHRIRSTLVFPDRFEESLKRQTGDPHSRRVRRVCGSCNNGWMSSLQVKARRFLVPMLKGDDTSFYKNGQTSLAAWVAMSVMVAEFLEPDKVAITAEERAWFMKNHRTPSHWRIWIGRYERSYSVCRWFHRVVPLAKNESEGLTDDFSVPIPNTQTSTILLGEYLVIHVMSSPIGRGIVKRWSHLPHIAPMMRQIWPVRDRVVGWPPPGVLSDADVEAMAEHFFSASDTVVRRRKGFE